MRGAAELLADPMGPLHRHISLMHGWVPVTVQVIAGLLVLLAIGWRDRRWRALWLPLAALVGLGAAIAVHVYIDANGLASNPVPDELWVWVACSGLALGVLALGWRSARWWRRGVSLLALPVCLLSAGLALNMWVGYFPTVQNAWNQLTAGPLPDQTDQAAVVTLARQSQVSHVLPAKGSVVPVTIPATASHFRHRGELVYLPPAWFASSPPPALPTVMMIGGEFNTPADWLRAGNAITTVDQYAAAHGGNAPVLVFVDSGGSFNNDTECVNGPRGNVADHLTKDVVPFMRDNFGVSPAAANWGIVGWSMGGTCAVDLATMHPDMFSSLVDIAGDLSPNSGTKAQTIDRLYGGSTAAWAAFDPSTVITKHGRYDHLSAWFAVNGDLLPHTVGVADTGPPGAHNGTGKPGEQLTAANTLCALGAADGIDCRVIAEPGQHDWPFAARVFADSLPWLAGAIGTPGDPVEPMAPAASRPAAAPRQTVQAAGR